MSYLRLAAAIMISTVVMYGLMYLNTYAVPHVRFSQTRAWMALLMGASMAPIMLLTMRGMYPNRRLNLMILVASVMVFATSLVLVRSQATVSDIAYMKAMIPHHSIAVLTSERARLRDPRVRRLADGIIAAQVREIGEMDRLIADLQRQPTPPGAPRLPPGSSIDTRLPTPTLTSAAGPTPSR
jgi:hypothetical protein